MTIDELIKTMRQNKEVRVKNNLHNYDGLIGRIISGRYWHDGKKIRTDVNVEFNYNGCIDTISFRMEDLEVE